MIKIGDKFQIDKDEIEKILFELYLLGYTSKVSNNHDKPKKSTDREKDKTKDDSCDRNFKRVEIRLNELFKAAVEPAWLTLFLIENSRDYHSNKMNTFASTIAKTFEKFASRVKINLDADLQFNAFKIATKHNILLLESITKAYGLLGSIDIFSEYVHDVAERFNFKDKAIFISCLNLHDFFDLEDVSCVNNNNP